MLIVANPFLGPVNYLHIFGQGLVFLNTPEAVNDLLEKRGSIYSDKPNLVMAGNLLGEPCHWKRLSCADLIVLYCRCGCENMVAFTPYGDRSRRQRRLMQSALGQLAIPRYHPLIEVETRLFLRRLLKDPSNYTKHIRLYAGGLTLSVVYGYQVASNDDPFLKLANDCVNILSNEIGSGGGIWPVDIFPSRASLTCLLCGSSSAIVANCLSHVQSRFFLTGCPVLDLSARQQYGRRRWRILLTCHTSGQKKS